MSFRIIGDEIEYERRPFARIIMHEHAVLRDCAIEELETSDPASREAEYQEWRDELETRHHDIVTELENKITDLETERNKLHAELEAINDYGGAAAYIFELKDDLAKWRDLALSRAATINELTKPKRRKRT